MYLKQIKLAVYCLIALLPNITNADTQDCPTLKYTARWVDIYNVAFYTNNFDVAIKRHNNLTSYVSPSYTGDCLYCIPGMPNTTEAIQNAINQWNNVQNTTINLVLNSGTSSSSKIVDPNDFMYLEGDGNYTSIVFVDETRYVDTKSMGVYENLLDPSRFFRIHKSHIINLSFVKEFLNDEGHFVVMKNNTRLAVSRLRVPQFIDLFKHDK